MSSIGVYVRFRPLSAKETAMDPNMKTVPFKFPNDQVVHDIAKNKDYGFDRAFAMNTVQQQVYDLCAEPLLQKCLGGYNGTLLAYGQTGAGKTYSMEGGDPSQPDQRGVIPRIVKDIGVKMFVEKSQIDYHLSVRKNSKAVSMLQIYKELIDDLLEPHKHDLKVHELRGEGFFIKDLTEQTITDPQQILDALTLGTSNRAVASTNMNKVSSRSHSVFILNIKQVNTMDGSIKKSKLVLVDLAGSERVGKTDAKGERLEEAKAINKSLSVLGNVINALTEKSKSHIPYRDSTLTKLLMNSLGGNSMTSLIIACSPAQYNYEVSRSRQESVSTLQFGIRAKMIKNVVKLNITRSAAELERLLNLAEGEIQRLKSVISFYEKGQAPPPELLQAGANAGLLGAPGVGSGPSPIGSGDGGSYDSPSVSTPTSGKKGSKRGVNALSEAGAGYEMQGSISGVGATRTMMDEEDQAEDSEAIANGDIIFLKERKDALRRELDIIQMEFSEMNSQKVELEVQLKMSNNRMINVLRELETYKSTDTIKENLDLRTNNQILRDQLDKSTLAYSEIYSELKLRKEQNEDNEDVLKLRKDFQNLKTMYDQLEEENSIVVNERDMIARQLTKLTNGIEGKIEMAINDDQYYEKLVLERDKLQKKLKKEKEKAQSDRDSLMEIQKNLQNQLKDYEKNEKELKKQHKKEVLALQKEAEKQKGFAEEALKKSGMKRDDLVALIQQNLNDTIKQLEFRTKDRDDLIEERDELEKKLQKQMDETNRLKNDYESLTASVTSGAVQTAKKKEGKISELQSELTEKTNALSTMKSDITSMSERIRQMEQDNTELSIQLNAAESDKVKYLEQYQQSASQCERLNRVIRASGKDDMVVRLQKEIDDLNRQFTDYRLAKVHSSEISAITDVIRGKKLAGMKKEKEKEESVSTPKDDSVKKTVRTNKDKPSSGSSLKDEDSPLPSTPKKKKVTKTVSPTELSQDSFSNTLLFSTECHSTGFKLTPNQKHLMSKETASVTFAVSECGGKLPSFGIISGADLRELSLKNSSSFGIDLNLQRVMIGGKHSKDKHMKPYEMGSSIELVVNLKSKSASLKIGRESYPSIFSGLKSPCVIGFFFDESKTPRIDLQAVTIK